MKEEEKQPIRESKTQRKNQMLALQKLGQALVELPSAQLALIPLDASLADAIAAARSIKSHEAKRRQLQYIGKLMREIDPLPIQTALDAVQFKNQKSKAKFHLVERWRDKLLAEGDVKLQEFMDQYPQADAQHIRQLLRQDAQTELFRYLRDLIESS